MDHKATLEALEANIVEACTNHELAHWKDDKYRACVSIGTDYFVKFGDPDDLWPELQTQSYIFDYNPHPDALCIPKVLHHFGDIITLTAGAPIDRTALALVWLSTVPGRNVSPLSPSLWACRLNPIPRWPYLPRFCGWWRIRHSVRHLVPDMGFELTFVIL